MLKFENSKMETIFVIVQKLKKMLVNDLKKEIPKLASHLNDIDLLYPINRKDTNPQLKVKKINVGCFAGIKNLFKI